MLFGVPRARPSPLDRGIGEGGRLLAGLDHARCLSPTSWESSLRLEVGGRQGDSGGAGI